MLSKPGPHIYASNLLSRHNHSEDKDEETAGIYPNINVTETCTAISECMMLEEIRYAAWADDDLNILTTYMINSLPSIGTEVTEVTQSYWPF